MMQVLALGVTVVLAVATTNAAALAQSPSVLLSEGVAAYEDVRFEVATTLLRQSLSTDARPALSSADRDRALMYLGAADLFRGERDSASVSFRRLVLANPRYRADQLIFPPRVTRLFDDVRETTKAVAVSLAREHTLVVGRSALTIRILASSAHPITASITEERGRTRRVLYNGAIEDSVRLSWNGRDASGAVLTTGRYRLDVVSRTSQDAVLRTERVPLRITRRQRPALPIPPPPEPVYRTEKVGATAGLKFLIPGVVIGAAVMLPAAIGDADATTARYAIGGAVTIGGILGFFSERGRTTRVEDTAATDSVRAAWRQSAADIERENARRAASIRLEIRSGESQRIEGAH